MKLKRVLCLMFAVSFLLAVLAGCGKKKQQSDETLEIWEDEPTMTEETIMDLSDGDSSAEEEVVQPEETSEQMAQGEVSMPMTGGNSSGDTGSGTHKHKKSDPDIAEPELPGGAVITEDYIQFPRI